ncbi:MAG: DUF4440 domain-containing protein [Caulobacteraceae bacterium]|nr:DUF4440 domain-containing protein [Caulobacteraceae bacterium]
MVTTAVDGEASAQAAVDAVTALERARWLHFAPDARVARTRAAIAIGAANGGPSDVTYRISRVEASAGGDLVMVLGEASWSANGRAVNSIYARMWQRQPDGWRVLYRSARYSALTEQRF